MNNHKNKNLVVYLDFFKNPHLNQKFLHITGTKGKTSVAYYLYHMLLSGNRTAGLFVSPHVYTEQERIQKNGEYITQKDLEEYKEKLKEAKAQIKVSLNFFEEFLLIAFLYFKDNPVDYIVLEVGIGGRYDSTNIIVPEVSIISRVQKDHQTILGRTLFQMFYQKLGIIKPGKPYIIGKQNFWGKIYIFLFTVFKSKKIKLLHYQILEIQGQNIVIYIDNNTIQLQGPYYMVENFALAYSVLKYIGIKYYHNYFIHNIPGRLQKIPHYNAYLDGAHNEIAIKVLVKSLKLQFGNKLWKIILCIREDKEMNKMIKILASIAQDFIILPWDEYLKPQFNSQLLISKLKSKNYPYLYLNKEILNKYIDTNDNILITGSFYHLSIIYEELTKDR